MGDLAYDESIKIFDTVPGICKKINTWTTNIGKLKSKNDFKKSHYVKLFEDSRGLLNKSLLETLGFSEIKTQGPKENDYLKRCYKYLFKLILDTAVYGPARSKLNEMEKNYENLNKDNFSEIKRHDLWEAMNMEDGEKDSFEHYKEWLGKYLFAIGELWRSLGLIDGALSKLKEKP